MTERHTILAVDDDPINLEIIEEILGDDYELTLAESGDEALAAAARLCPDLILLDIMMPGIDGYETCRRLRANADVRHAKIVLVSAKAMVSERLAGYEAGADDYITKPFDKNELIAKVRVYLRLLSVEELDRLKGDLVDLLAHEIRTPLTGIIPAGELLMTPGEMPDDQRVMWGEMILDNGKRLLALAEKGMLLCRLRAGSRIVKQDEVDLVALAHKLAAGLQSPDESRKLTFSATTPESLRIVGDAALLEIVLEALLSNAVRFGPDDGEVRVEIGAADGRASFSIADDGPGIPEEDRARIFEAFAARRIERQTVGSGISLALARSILRAHGGDIDVDSVPGHGSTFTGWLPARSTAAQRAGA